MRISDWSSDVCSSDLLDLSGLWRRRQAAAIIAHIEVSTDRYPTVLMGDLNEWSAMAGCLRDFGRDYHFAETGPSFHARRPIARLDRIMVSSDLIVADAGVHFSPAARKRSEERRVGKEDFKTFRSLWSPYPSKKT